MVASSIRRVTRPRTPSPSCHSAGIQVRMITGDHAVTAAAIGHQLGIEGTALTGAQSRPSSDDELVKGIGRYWRGCNASPRRTRSPGRRPAAAQGNIVAMTGTASTMRRH